VTPPRSSGDAGIATSTSISRRNSRRRVRIVVVRPAAVGESEQQELTEHEPL
jgi:hypothetical protein